ncbi:phosphoglycerate mutase [Bacillus manliponensis]|uniref:Phosphoglycerate mutase n=1 Tax=Bacillus manliponensis TaxID=574376 RepID=A0A073K289_9BACI|nr:histidine phosphatase family protein [Bacillus manliponensis]KEK20681.1 phosphoglycerate mutase [Bacillus manliponensis]
MTTIYFVRHAHSTYTKDERERPLSEKGWKDAMAVTDLFKTEDIDIVLSSPYKRAIQTVEGIAAHFQFPILVEEDLRERLLSVEPLENFQEGMMEVWGNPMFSFPGGESNEVAQKRGVTCMKQILEKYEGKSVVIGTHGNIMVLIMNYFDEKYDMSFWKELEMPDVYKLTFSNKKLQTVIKMEYMKSL